MYYFKNKNKTVKKIQNQIPDIENKLSNDIINFENICNSYFKFVEDKVPQKIPLKCVPTENFSKIFAERPSKGMNIITYEVNQDKDFINFISQYKANELLQNILELLNKQQFYSLYSLLRTLMEVVASFVYTIDKINPLISKMNQNLYDYKEYSKIHKELEMYTRAFIYGTRHETKLKTQVETMNSVNILTCLEYVEKIKKNNFLKCYHHICDYVHPNISSHQVFGRITSKIKSKEEDSENILTFYNAEMEEYFRDMNINSEKSLNIPNTSFIIIEILDCIELLKEYYYLAQKINLEELKQELKLKREIDLEYLKNVNKQTFDYLRKNKKIR